MVSGSCGVVILVKGKDVEAVSLGFGKAFNISHWRIYLNCLFNIFYIILDNWSSNLAIGDGLKTSYTLYLYLIKMTRLVLALITSIGYLINIDNSNIIIIIKSIFWLKLRSTVARLFSNRIL